MPFLATLMLAVLSAQSASSREAPDDLRDVIDEATLRDPTALVAWLRHTTRAVTPWPERFPYETLHNAEAPVPPQCYTRTEGQHNPCYVCHQAPIRGRENIQGDHGLQAEYAFSDVGFTNHWTNLFEDRRERADAISDAAIVDWVRADNYSELAGRLRAEGFGGWIPDLADLQEGAAAFDEQGFARDGSDWVAFNYKPLPSTFWPTNGAMDDVMIRLPEAFRTTPEGRRSRDVYAANLALLELGIKDAERIGCLPVDEAVVGADLDGDGQLGTAHHVLRRDRFVGAASELDLLDGMYPQETEFLHTVRYLDPRDDGSIQPSRRLKEVRYMRRHRMMRKSWAAYHYLDEQLDKEAGKLPHHKPLHQRQMLRSETSWELSGFIEGPDGRLRSNSFEETFFCMGCHNSLGSTVDKTFSFARKVDGRDGWRYIDLRGMPDAPSRGETEGEIATYLRRSGGGSEFRNNDEMRARWFDAAGELNTEAVAAAADVYELIVPTADRARRLNKAYRVLVEDQDWIFGRDPSLAPPANVYDAVDPEKAPTLPEHRQFRWDLRLDWGRREEGAR